MTTEKLCSMVDHTLLAQTATWEDIKGLCDDAMAYKTASVCIPPCYVKQAAEKIKLLEKAYASRDLRAYTVQVHGLKSNAKMIGAMKLADLAFELEKAGKEGKIDFIKEKQRPFMKEFVAVLEEAKRIAGL